MQHSTPTKPSRGFIAASVVLLLGLIAAPAQGQQFSPQQVITSNADSARSVHAADLDGDGDEDILAAIGGDDTIAWYENFGNDGIGSQQVITTNADDAFLVLAADLDGDGDQDVVSTSSGDSKLAWYENTGEGFSGQNVIDTPGAQGLFVEDINGDEDQDILYASLAFDEVGWYENNGDGTFSSKKVINDNAQRANAVRAADLDGDGDRDVLSAALDGDNVVWYENEGGGSFSEPNVITSGASGARSVRVADLDGDNDKDVLYAAGFSEYATIWHENTGGGSFSGQNVISTAPAVESVYPADLTGDGDIDIVTGSGNQSSDPSEERVSWYENTDGGVFSEEKIITSDIERVESVYVVDVDGDHGEDVVSASFNDDTVAWYTNQTVDETSPSSPTGLQATAGDGQVELNWDANTESDLEGYNIYRSTSEFYETASATRVNEIPIAEESYVDHFVENGVEYFYRITAVDDAGNESLPSELVSAVPSYQAPEAPTGLEATASEGHVDLGWEVNGETRAVGFNVYRSTSSFQEVANATKINGSLVESLSYTDISVSNGTEYFYRVTAVDESGNESEPSGEASAMPEDHTAPSAPTGLQATAADGEVGLGWDSNSESDLTGYNVYRSTSSFQGIAEATRLNNAPVETESYVDSSVTNGTEYFYRVTAVDDSGNESEPSNRVSATPEDETPPSAPVALEAAAADEVVDLGWEANTERDLAGYNVYRSTSSFQERANATQLNESLADSASYADSSVTNGTEYFYRVTAVDEAGNESELSGQVSVTPEDQTPPSAPVALEATAADEEVDLGWEANAESDLAGYNVYRSASSFQEPASATRINEALVDTPSYVDASVSNGTEYYYRVTAVDEAENESNPSNQASVTPRGVPLVTTESATDVTSESARFHGTVNPNGTETTVVFEYFPTGEPGQVETVGAEESPLTGMEEQSVSAAVEGLDPSREYTVRVVAENADGNAQGEGQTFTTNAAAPVATTQPATDVTSDAAQLQGTVDPNGPETTVAFEYFPSGEPGQMQSVGAEQSPLEGPEEQSVSAVVHGLDPSREYTFRVVAENAEGNDQGGDQTFMTDAAPPEVTTDDAENITPTGAHLNGTVTPNRAETNVVFEYASVDRPDDLQSVEAAESPLTGEGQQSVSAEVDGLDPGTEYSFRVVATNEGGTASGEEVTFATTPLEITLDRSVETPERGTPLDMSVSVSEGFEPTEVQLFYRRGGAPEFQSVSLEEVGGATFEGTVPGEAVTERGVDYYARVSDGSVTATVPAENPSEVPRHAPVQVPQQTAGVELPAEEYAMVSVPLDLSSADAIEALADDFGEMDRAEWRLLRWDAADEQYVEATGGESATAEFVPGVAYWLISREGGTFDVENGESVSGGPVTLTLPPGWTQLANPRAYPVAWSDIEGTESANEPVAYDPSGSDSLQFGVSVLEPWTGYWVFNPTGSSAELTVPEKEATSSGPAVAATASSNASLPEQLFGSEPTYALQLKATLDLTEGTSEEGGLRDVYNVVGVSNRGRAGVGLEDVAEPPPIGESLRLSVVEDGTRLAGSLRPTGEDGYTWTLELSTSSVEEGPRNVRVKLRSFGALPAETERRLMDGDTGRRIPIEEGAFSVQLTEERPTRQLQLIIGTEEFAKSESDSIEPDRSGLRAIYPNPSPGNVSVDYQLDSAQRVQISVYDILGRRVKTLIDERRPAGHHTVRWDGRSGTGPVASGAYIVRIETESMSSSQRVSIVQ